MIGNSFEISEINVKEVGNKENIIPEFAEKLNSGIRSFDVANRPLTDPVEKFHTINEKLEGKNHPETGVPFEKRIVENNENNLVEVVVPKFDSVYEAQLPENLYLSTDRQQFNECNNQLIEATNKNLDLKSKFNGEQLEQIYDGETPDGYVWHHDAEKGEMELVDEYIHGKTAHTGGKSIWGGGNENR